MTSIGAIIDKKLTKKECRMNYSDNKVEIRYYSGYIRNYKKLCEELSIPADLSREEREARILVKAYETWQLSMMEHLYGMFAFALFDKEQKKIYCVRDQVGQKQMFYAVIGGEFVCSGDINEIVSKEGFEKKLNRVMLQQYLFYGYPIGSDTFYEGVYKLMPGHYAEWDGKSVKLNCYWRPVFEPDMTKNAEDWSREIQQTVEEILDEERADDQLPYKESFLSGGVDSSYLFAASDAVCANTIGYEESGFDESALARYTAQVLKRTSASR